MRKLDVNIGSLIQPIQRMIKNGAWTLLFLTICVHSAHGQWGRFRASWRENPATTMVIGWDRISTKKTTFYYDTQNGGLEISKYRYTKAPDVIYPFKGMNNEFVRLTGLTPNTLYYGICSDGTTTSKPFQFQTCPSTSDKPLSIISGGDSRNNRAGRKKANELAGKLRPHVILFNGDMTDGDTEQEWKEWLDDWQLTKTAEGRLTPVLVCRGNHEQSNETLSKLFDVPNEKCYYALSFHGDLIRIYTLNSLLPSGGLQRDWLYSDLQVNQAHDWVIAQYHYPMRSHTSEKPEQLDQILNWATLFTKFGVDLAMESDGHIAKSTFPIRPAAGLDADESFIRDDAHGTVYVGEGGWGAPLRFADDNKSWTRASDAFNHFEWIWVTKEKMEVRFIKTDCSPHVKSLQPDQLFQIPPGLDIWNPPSGNVITLKRIRHDLPEDDVFAQRGPGNSKLPNQNGEAHGEPGIKNLPKLLITKEGFAPVKYLLAQTSDVELRVFNMRRQQVYFTTMEDQPEGEYVKNLELGPATVKGNYILIIRANNRAIAKYMLVKTD